MQNVLNVVVIFKSGRIEKCKDVESAKFREGGYYQIIRKDGTNIKLPLTSIEQIVENSEEEGVKDWWLIAN